MKAIPLSQWKGNDMPRTCYKTELAGFPISLKQTGIDNFIVTYGGEVKTGLDYATAATNLGAAIMHALLVKAN